jgi:hypothetical protein
MMLGMLPDFGAPVTFFLNADCRERVPIKVPLAAKQITRMNRDVAFALRHGKRKASNRLISIAQEIEAERKPKTSDEDKIASLQAPITEKCDRTFAKHAAEPVNHIIKITSTAAAAAAAESPGKPSYVQRAAIAKAVVRELRRRADEDDRDFAETIAHLLPRTGTLMTHKWLRSPLTLNKFWTFSFMSMARRTLLLVESTIRRMSQPWPLSPSTTTRRQSSCLRLISSLTSSPLPLPRRLRGPQARTSWLTMLLTEHPRPALTMWLLASCPANAAFAAYGAAAHGQPAPPHQQLGQ